MTTVSSASKISLIRSLARRVNAGGVATLLLALPCLLPDLREKMPEVQVWYFLFFFSVVARSGDVLGRGCSEKCEDCSSGVLSADSSLLAGRFGDGVCCSLGLNQKCFFLLGGLPDRVTAGEPEADNGRLGRLTASSFADCRATLASKVAGSAVLGRGLATGSSMILGLVGELSVDELCGAWLAIELMLPERE
jgi:hypothetical protein